MTFLLVIDHKFRISSPIFAVSVHFPLFRENYYFPPTLTNFPPLHKFTCFLHTLRVFRFPPTFTMMHLCINQCTYWTPRTRDNRPMQPYLTRSSTLFRPTQSSSWIRFQIISIFTYVFYNCILLPFIQSSKMHRKRLNENNATHLNSKTSKSKQASHSDSFWSIQLSNQYHFLRQQWRPPTACHPMTSFKFV